MLLVYNGTVNITGSLFIYVASSTYTFALNEIDVPSTLYLYAGEMLTIPSLSNATQTDTQNGSLWIDSVDTNFFYLTLFSQNTTTLNSLVISGSTISIKMKALQATSAVQVSNGTWNSTAGATNIFEFQF